MVSDPLLSRLTKVRGRVSSALHVAESLADPAANDLLDELGAAVEELDTTADALIEADRQIPQAQQRYRDLFELAPDAYLEVDERGVILEANRAAQAMLRVAKGELVGKPLAAFLGPSEDTGLRRLLDTAVRYSRPRVHSVARQSRQRVGDWETVIRPRSGSPCRAWVRALADPVSDGDGSRIRVLIRDISNRVKAADYERREHVLLRAHAQRLEALETVKADLLRLLSHELGTPVTVVRGYVSMMADGSLGDVGQRAAAVLPIILRRCDEMARLIDQMLEIARLEEPRLGLDRRPAELGAIVEEVVSQMRPVGEVSDRRLRLVPAAIAIPVLVDAAKLGTILSNLIGNAFKYSVAGSEVVCEVGREAGTATVAIRDQGPGVPADQLGVLFTKFGRVVTPETAHIHGTGLGLYLSRELARAQGGDLRVRSVEGVGSTFTLSVPLEDGARRRSDHSGAQPGEGAALAGKAAAEPSAGASLGPPISKAPAGPE
ncbi:MAG TPA: ATP-binding protein [Candidatus Binatia bacterium]|nr:ATP-binding protein [Candidatus Binatia bacterium]